MGDIAWIFAYLKDKYCYELGRVELQRNRFRLINKNGIQAKDKGKGIKVWRVD